MRRHILRTIWLSAQGAFVICYLLSTARDRGFIFYGPLALSFPAGLLVHVAAAVGVIAVYEHLHVDPGGLVLDTLWWASVVAVGYWQWFVFIPRHVLGRV